MKWHGMPLTCENHILGQVLSFWRCIEPWAGSEKWESRRWVGKTMGLKQGTTHTGRLHRWLGKDPISETEVKSRRKLVLYPSHIDMDVNRLTKEHRDVGQGEAQIREVEWAGCIRLRWPRGSEVHARTFCLHNKLNKSIYSSPHTGKCRRSSSKLRGTRTYKRE